MSDNVFYLQPPQRIPARVAAQLIDRALDAFVVWYFDNIWRGRLCVTLPLATSLSLIQFELCIRAYLSL